MTRPRMHIPNLDDLVQRYIDGEPAKKLAQEVRISDSVLRKRLRERGITIRDTNSYPRNMEPCWAASRARIGEPEWRRHQRAKTNAARMNNVSVHEDRLFALILDRGIIMNRQRTIGPYNVDLAYEPLTVAVEVLGGGYGPGAKARRPARLEYLFNEGWHLLEVSVGKSRPVTGIPDLSGAADYVVAFLDELRRNPPTVRQHRMIRRDGEPRSSRRPYLDCRADPLASVSASDST